MENDPSSALHNGPIPVLGRDHDSDGPHAAEVGAGHSAGWGNRGVTRGPLVLISRYLVVLGLGVLVQV